MGNPAASVLKVHPDLVPSPLSPSESPNRLSSSCSLSPVTCSLVRSTGGETEAELEQPPTAARFCSGAPGARQGRGDRGEHKRGEGSPPARSRHPGSPRAVSVIRYR